MKSRIMTTVVLLIVAVSFTIPTIIIPDAGVKSEVKLMSYNIHQFYVADYVPAIHKTGQYVFDELLNVINQEDPDIIGLQESEGSRINSGNQNGVFWLATKMNMYYYYGPPTADQIYGVSILSKWPIIAQEWKLMPNEESIERAVIRVVIDTPMGEIIAYNTHFQTSSYKIDQRKQAEFVIDYIGDEKAILFGDFNTRADLNDEAYTLLNNSFTYAWVEAGNHPNASEGFTSPAMDPGHKVDYIWLSGEGWDVIEDSAYTAGNEWASDHLAVMASILL